MDRATETIATGAGIREIARLRKRYGRGRGEVAKRKGIAEIRLASGEIVGAELHRYEATGIGKLTATQNKTVWGQGRQGRPLHC